MVDCDLSSKWPLCISPSVYGSPLMSFLPFTLYTTLVSVLVVQLVQSSPQPFCSITSPASVILIGESFTFTVSFTNLGTDQGYYPFLDILIAPQASITQASLFQSLAQYSSLNFQNSSCVTHSLISTTVCSSAGTKIITYELPFASFYPSQPPANVSFTASLR